MADQDSTPQVSQAEVERVIHPVNRGWFDKMNPAEQADFLRRERERDTAIQAHIEEEERKRASRPDLYPDPYSDFY